jgi:ABC-type phosphate/phosphonate transport system ATPase subunit
MKKMEKKGKTIAETTHLSMREKLVGNILYYAGDEYETKDDIIDLAMQTEDQLIERLINILDYYYDRAQELS